jgi:hypothetical protein
VQAVLDRPRERVPGRRDVHELRSSGGRLAAAPGAPVLPLSRPDDLAVEIGRVTPVSALTLQRMS